MASDLVWFILKFEIYPNVLKIFFKVRDGDVGVCEEKQQVVCVSSYFVFFFIYLETTNVSGQVNGPDKRF